VQNKDHGKDTVGVICVDSGLNLASGASTGGPWNKLPGRLGPAGHFGACVWSEKIEGEGVACATSGKGEKMIENLVAYKWKQTNLPSLNCFEEEEETKEFGETISELNFSFGLISITISSKENKATFYSTHTCDNFPICYITSSMKKPKAFVNEKPQGTKFISSMYSFPIE